MKPLAWFAAKKAAPQPVPMAFEVRWAVHYFYGIGNTAGKDFLEVFASEEEAKTYTQALYEAAKFIGYRFWSPPTFNPRKGDGA